MQRRPSLLVSSVLVFQLAVGMHWPVALTTSIPQHPLANSSHAEHCPGHPAPRQRSTPLGAKHDCCRSAGCQCHCTYTVGITDLPGMSIDAPSTGVPTIAAALVIAARPDELFRPPIA